MNALENLKPFFDSALAPFAPFKEAGSATAPDLSESPVAVAVNSISASAETCGGMDRTCGATIAKPSLARTPSHGASRETPVAGIKPGPQDSISVSAISAEGGVPAGEIAPPNPPLVGTSNPELAEGPVVAPRQTESFAARSLGPGRKKDQASIPESALAPLPIPTGPTPAADALRGSAAFSFQPDFEKLFNTIFELTDMQAMLICADEELRVETLLGDRTRA